MKKFFVWAVLVMAGVCGFAQESGSEGVVSSGTELATTAKGQKVTMWDMKMDDASGDVSFVISVDKATAGDLWQLCRMWLAENVKQYNQIKQIEDKAEGMLMVNCTLPLKVEGIHTTTNHLSRWIGSQTWKMTVKCKDERFRVQLTEYKTSWKLATKDARFGWMELLTRENIDYKETVFHVSTDAFAPAYKGAVEFIVQSLGEYIGKKAGEDDDF